MLVSLIARIHGSRNQGAEVGVAPLTITLNDPLAKLLLPVTLCPDDLVILVPVEGMLPPRDKMTPLNLRDTSTLIFHVMIVFAGILITVS